MQTLEDYGVNKLVITYHPKPLLDLEHIAVTQANELCELDGGTKEIRFDRGGNIPNVETKLIFCTPNTRKEADIIAKNNNCEVIQLWN